jgi:hypothetical protein
MGTFKARLSAAHAEGHLVRRRAGLSIPAGKGFLDVWVVDSDEDPPGRQINGDLTIGRRSWELIKSDDFIQKATVDEAVAARAEAASALADAVIAENDTLKARLAELEAQLRGRGRAKTDRKPDSDGAATAGTGELALTTEGGADKA